MVAFKSAEVNQNVGYLADFSLDSIYYSDLPRNKKDYSGIPAALVALAMIAHGLSKSDAPDKAVSHGQYKRTG